MGRAVADVCGNCGAPLELDAAGRCVWCHAHVHVEQPLDSFGVTFLDTAGASLVPEDVDLCLNSEVFIFVTMTQLGPVLSREPAVLEYVRGEPGLLEQIRALTTAVSAAGVRVRDNGLVKSDLELNLKVFTPEEIWTFDLAIDVIAMLGTLDGLSKATHAKVTKNLSWLADTVHSHDWRKALKKAGEGPVEFHQLRAGVPRRTPRRSLTGR